MAEKKTSLGGEFTKGLIRENPVLVIMLGTCPTLAISTNLENSIGMGIAATIVLFFSNIVISMLRKVIPDKVRIPCFIVVIAAFVSIIQMFVKAFAPSLDAALGIYLPLIVVNCIILGRAEAFASKNNVLRSAIDGLGMGVGFTLALALMAIIREFFGSGNLTLKVLGHGTTLVDICHLATATFSPPSTRSPSCSSSWHPADSSSMVCSLPSRTALPARRVRASLTSTPATSARTQRAAWS